MDKVPHSAPTRLKATAAWFRQQLDASGAALLAVEHDEGANVCTLVLDSAGVGAAGTAYAPYDLREPARLVFTGVRSYRGIQVLGPHPWKVDGHTARVIAAGAISFHLDFLHRGKRHRRGADLARAGVHIVASGCRLEGEPGDLSERAAQPLLAVLANGDERARDRAQHRLWVRSRWPAMAAALCDPAYSTQGKWHILRMLHYGRLHPWTEAAPVVAELLHHPDHELRRQAAESLADLFVCLPVGRHRPLAPAAAAALMRHLQAEVERSSPDTWRALWAAGVLNPFTRIGIDRYLAHPDARVRHQAADLLDTQPDARWLTPLQAALAVETDEEVREQMEHAILSCQTGRPQAADFPLP